MTFGVTSTGFNRKLFSDILSSIETYQQVNISANIQQQNLISQAINQPERSVIGNINYIVTDELSQAWEQLEIAANGLDPDAAVDFMLQGLGRITGINPEGATAGTVTLQCALEAGFSAAIGGMVVNQLGFVNNTWHNTAAIGPVAGGTYSVTFIADTLGALGVVGANGFQINGTPPAGWTAVANAQPSTDGQNVESEEAFRARRRASVAAAGSDNLDAIIGAVSEVSCVLSVTGRENTLSTAANGLPPNSFRIVVWDGAGHAASPVDILRAIFTKRAPGVQSAGAQNGLWPAASGDLVPINFDYSAPVDVYVTYTLAGSYDSAAALTALRNAMGAGHVKYAALFNALYTLPGVTDVTSLHVGLVASPTGTSNIAVSYDQTAILYNVNGVLV